MSSNAALRCLFRREPKEGSSFAGWASTAWSADAQSGSERKKAQATSIESAVICAFRVKTCRKREAGLMEVDPIVILLAPKSREAGLCQLHAPGVNAIETWPGGRISSESQKVLEMGLTSPSPLM